ncbi:MAG: hypothetical protein ACLUTO_03660 [Anaerostipes sp.]
MILKRYLDFSKIWKEHGCIEKKQKQIYPEWLQDMLWPWISKKIKLKKRH